MKLNSLFVLWLPLILFHTSVAGKGKSGGGGRIISRGTKTTNKGNTHSNTNAGHKTTQSGSHRNTGPNNQGGRINSYPVQHGVVVHSGFSRPGSYPGGYINYNPNNQILSPRYGGRFGNGAYGTRGGSPFSHRVAGMGVYPSSRSQGFGHTAAQAVTGAMMFRMAAGYGLARSPRQDIHFHNSHQEYHYNQHMYRKYGSRSTDTNDYSRDYKYSPSPQTYDMFMRSCMNRPDLLPAESPNRTKPRITTTPAPVASSNTEAITNTTKADSGNNTAMDPSDSSSPLSPLPLNQSESKPDPPASLVVSGDEDDDTVSIVEIGYPALIEQMKTRRCVEMYIDYSDQFLRRVHGGVEGLKMGFEQLLSVLTSTLLILHNSNMLLC